MLFFNINPTLFFHTLEVKNFMKEKEEERKENNKELN